MCGAKKVTPQTRPTRAFQRALSLRIARTSRATPGAAAPHHPRSGNAVHVRAPPATARARDHHREGSREGTGEDYVSALADPVTVPRAPSTGPRVLRAGRRREASRPFSTEHAGLAGVLPCESHPEGEPQGTDHPRGRNTQ